MRRIALIFAALILLSSSMAFAADFSITNFLSGVFNPTGRVVADSTISQWSVSISASPQNPAVGASVALTATSNQDVGPTPYIIAIFEGTARIHSCGTGTSCQTTVTSTTAAAKTYTAKIEQAGGGNIQAVSSPVSITWSAPADVPAPSVPSCWTCSASLYNSWISDTVCDDQCGETAGPGLCHSDACVPPTTTTSSTSTTTSTTTTIIAQDTQPPSILVSTSPSGTNSVILAATATDNVRVSSIKIYVDDDNNPNNAYVVKKECLSSSCSVTLGPYPSAITVSYYVLAYDDANNQGYSGISSFAITAAPTTTTSTTSTSTTTTIATVTSFSVSLSASSASVATSTSVTLTATSNQDVGPTPYIIAIFEGASRITSCGTGTTCEIAVTSSTPATKSYNAKIEQTGGGNVQATSNAVSVTWTATASSTTTTTISAPQCPAPSIPSDSSIRCQNIQSNQLSFAWNAVGGATGYNIEWCPSVAFGSASCSSALSSRALHTATGLSSGTIYNFRVSITSSDGSCKLIDIWSATESCTTPAASTPTPAPDPCGCDITQKPWQLSGGCGQQGCAANEMPQFRACATGCPAQNRCNTDPACVTPTPTPTQPSVPSCWTCASGYYSSWLSDTLCDDYCGETVAAGPCHSDACSQQDTTTSTTTSIPIITPSLPECSYDFDCDYPRETCQAGRCVSGAPTPIITEDKEPPSLLISTSPSGNAVVLTATATDNVAVSSIRIYADEGSEESSLKKECASPPCSSTFGPYSSKTTVSYFATAYDTSNNQKTSDVQSFTVIPKELAPAPTKLKESCESYGINGINIAPGAVTPALYFFGSYTSNNHEEYVSSLNKPDWVYLSSPKIYPKTEYKNDNPVLLWTIVTPPRNTPEGVYTFELKVTDSNNNVKATEKACINVGKNAESIQNTEFKAGDTIKIGVIDIGTEKQADYETLLEDLIEHATSGQFKDKVEYLGRLNADIDDIINNKKFTLLSDFIKGLGKNPDDYDYILTIGQAAAQGFDIIAQTEGKYFDNIKGKNLVNMLPVSMKFFGPTAIDTYLHEISHPLSNRLDSPYYLIFFPPTAGYTEAAFYSNPYLSEIGLEPHEKGVYLLVEEFGYQEAKHGEKLTYHVRVRNTGKAADTYSIKTDNDISNKESVVTISEPYGIANVKISEIDKKTISAINKESIRLDGKQSLTAQVTLNPGQTATLILEIDTSQLNLGLYGFQVTAESVSNKGKIDFSKLKMDAPNIDGSIFKKENVAGISGGIFMVQQRESKPDTTITQISSVSVVNLGDIDDTQLEAFNLFTGLAISQPATKLLTEGLNTEAYQLSFSFDSLPKDYNLLLQYKSDGDWANFGNAFPLGNLKSVEGNTIKLTIKPVWYIKKSGIYEFRLLGSSATPSSTNFEAESKPYIQITFQAQKPGGTFSADKKTYTIGEEIKLAIRARNSKKLEILIENKWESFACVSEECSNAWTLKASSVGDYTYQARITDLNDKIIALTPLTIIVSENENTCPFSCLENDACSLKGGLYKSDFSCPGTKVYVSYEIPQVCCQFSAAEISEASEDIIGAVDTVLESLKSGLETEGESFSGFGVVKWFNLVEIFRSGSKLQNLDDQIFLYTAIRTDLESGRTMKEILTTYRSFLDSSGKINKQGKKFLDEKYGDLVRPGKLFAKYDEECVESIFRKVKENKENEKKPETYECQRLEGGVKNSILDLRAKEESILKNSINPLTLALERYDKAVRNEEYVDEIDAEIFYQTAKLVEKKANEGLSAEFYNTIVVNYPDTPRVAAAQTELNRLSSFGHKAWMFAGELGVSLFGLDNLIPINPCKGPVKVACKFAAVSKGLGSKKALSLAFSMPKLLTLSKEKTAQELVKRGVQQEKAGLLSEMLHKIGQGGATDAEKSEASKIIREAFGIPISKGKLRKEIATLLPDAEKVLLGSRANKFASVLVESETIKNSPALRSVAIKMVLSDVPEKSITEVLEKGTSASAKSIDDVFTLYIKPHIKSVPATTSTELRSFALGEAVSDTARKLENAGLSADEVHVLMQEASWSNIIRWKDAPDWLLGELKPFAENILNAVPDHVQFRWVDLEAKKSTLTANELLELNALLKEYPKLDILPKKTRAEMLVKIANRDSRALASEVRSIARKQRDLDYTDQFLADLRKHGDYTIQVGRTVLAERTRQYVEYYARIGFLSAENSKLFSETAAKMADDLVEVIGTQTDDVAVRTFKLLKIDELTHKVVAIVAHLEHVASGQKFSDHSYRHLHEDLSKVLGAVESYERTVGSNPFTRTEIVHTRLISFVHDVGYSDPSIVQKALDFKESKTHPERAFEFVKAELSGDLKEILGERSESIISKTIEADMKEVIGSEGAGIVMHAVRVHGDKAFKYSVENLNNFARHVASLFILADDLAVDKAHEVYGKHPEIVRIMVEFLQDSKNKPEIAAAIKEYSSRLNEYWTIKTSDTDGAARIYAELVEMDHGNTVLGNFRTGYRQKMLDALEKYRSSTPELRFRQYQKMLEQSSESDFAFHIPTAVIERTSIQLVKRPDGQRGVHVIMEVSEPLYSRLSQIIGEKDTKAQITKILKDLVARGSNNPPPEKDVERIAEDLFKNRGGAFGPGNDIEIKFVQEQSKGGMLRDVPVAALKTISEDVVKSLQSDVKEFLILNGDTVLLDDFYRQFPQYKSYSLEEMRQNLPQDIDLVTDAAMGIYSKGELFLAISEKAYTKFVYRGENTNMIQVLEIFKKQEGIGSTSTYVSTRPGKAGKYLAPDGGLWIMKNAATGKLAGLDLGEVEIAGIIPFKYVDKLLVTEDMRNAILKKYGADNTRLFGRPLKEVVIAGFDPDQPELLGRTIRELILQTPRVIASEAEMLNALKAANTEGFIRDVEKLAGKFEWQFTESQKRPFRLYLPKGQDIQAIRQEVEQTIDRLVNLLDVNPADMVDLKIIAGIPQSNLVDAGGAYVKSARTLVVGANNLGPLPHELVHWLTRGSQKSLLLDEGIAYWAAYRMNPLSAQNYRKILRQFEDAGVPLIEAKSSLTGTYPKSESYGWAGAHLFDRIEEVYGINKVNEVWKAAKSAPEGASIRDILEKAGLDYSVVERSWRYLYLTPDDILTSFKNMGIENPEKVVAALGEDPAYPESAARGLRSLYDLQSAGARGTGPIIDDVRATLNQLDKSETGSIKLRYLIGKLCTASIFFASYKLTDIIYEFIKIKNVDDFVELQDDGGLVSHITQKQTIPMLEERIRELNEIKNSRGARYIKLIFYSKLAFEVKQFLDNKINSGEIAAIEIISAGTTLDYYFLAIPPACGILFMATS